LTIPTLAFFFFQFAFCAAASTIASGLMAERTDFKADLAYSFLTGLFIYPVFGHWVWGGGWLAQWATWILPVRRSSTWSAPTLAWPARLCWANARTRFSASTSAATTSPWRPGYVFILWLGWFGFNPGSQLCRSKAISLIVVTTDFAATTGAIAAMFLAYSTPRKWDVSMAFNGALGGLVAITAPCAFVTPQGALMIGAIAGTITYYGVD
jgi:ammonium transporter, Amt family